MDTEVISLPEYARRRRSSEQPAEGHTLQALRRRAGLSQQELAAALTQELGVNVRPGTIHAWEHGTAAPPPDILAIAKRLPPLPGGPELPPDTESELQHGLSGGRIGAHIVSWAGNQVAALSRLDDLVGGARVLPLATANLELLTQLISQATYNDTHATELQRTIAEIARLAGWVAFDAGHTDKASLYWRTAITAAREASDRDYSAYSMAFLAFHAIDRQRDPAAALRLLHAAEQEASRDAPLQIVLAQWAVQPYGLLGEHREAQRSLTRADSLWERRNPENDPPWLYWMYLPSLTPEVPRGIIPGNPRRAEAMFMDGLNALSDEYPRDRTLFCLGLAEARLSQHGRLDEAIAATRTAINLVSAAPSPRVHERLRRLIHSLPKHPDTAELREALTCPSADRTYAT
jgi:DNA-binding transcriptional regulator YiaG/tetratricopeptide (TPR) repeat protein